MKSDHNIKALVNYRIEQSEDCLQAAALMFEKGLFRDSVNRSYYAMFYIILALLCFKGEKASKHTHVISLFDQIFVKDQIFPKEFSVWLHEAFDLRQRADYREMINITEQRAGEILGMSKGFVEKIKEFLQSQ
jgi:uncharacterized protein (UPF0332 family)